LETNKYQTAVSTDLQQGVELGVTGTPAFFLNGYPLVGAQPFDVFKSGIETLLAQSPTESGEEQ
jgi:protein-disulfide isomerase